MVPIEQDGKSGPGRLSVIAVSLDAISRESEPRFMKIGMKLQSIYSDATELTRQTLETVKLIGGESEEGLLAKGGMLVKTSLEKVKNCQATAARNHSLAKAHVKEVANNLGNSFSLCADLKKTAKYLRAVGLQMCIECSRTNRSMEMFSVVAQEIGALSGRFMETAEKIREDSEAALQGQVSAQAEISESLNQLFRLADDTEQTVQLSMKKTEQIMRVSLEALDHAGLQSRGISQHVGEIVMGIQFHDNMRQRIEHIIKALVDTEKRCPEAALSSDPTPPSKEAGAACAILELQKAQLQNIISEINLVHKRARYAFQEIANEVVNLTQGLSSLETEISALSLNRKGETQDPFESLKSGLRHIHRLIDQGFSLVEHMHQTAAQASKAVTGLSSHTERVRELSFETHLTAINAMVKAKQLGAEGMALDKLVQEARSVSGRSNIFVGDIEKIQHMILASAGVLQSQTQERMSDEEAQISPDALLEEISSGSAQFRENSLDAARRANVLEKVISDVKADLDFLPALARELTEHQRQLEEIIQALNLSAGQEANLTPEEIDEIHKRYTVQEESKVHEQFIVQTGDPVDADGGDPDAEELSGKGADPESCESSSNKKTDTENDLGDNVEFF